MFYYTVYQSPVGKLTIAADESNIVGLWLEGQKYFLGTLPERPVLKNDLEVFGCAKAWLERYFLGQKPRCDELPLRPMGGEFRRAVWRQLCLIPYGEVTTYGELAKKVATELEKDKMSARAVGGAVGRNPISIIIPCHRVVGAGGGLVGYAGGTDKKVQLLRHEGVDIGTLKGSK